MHHYKCCLHHDARVCLSKLLEGQQPGLAELVELYRVADGVFGVVFGCFPLYYD